jgi:hypothetical protein
MRVLILAEMGGPKSRPVEIVLTEIQKKINAIERELFALL